MTVCKQTINNKSAIKKCDGTLKFDYKHLRINQMSVLNDSSWDANKNIKLDYKHLRINQMSVLNNP